MERLTPTALREAQTATLAAPKMAYGLLSRALFTTMDLLNGRRRTL